MSNEIKVYVEVEAKFDQSGRVIPCVIVWENGRRYTIEKIVDVRHAAAQRAGGMGERFTVFVNGKSTYLFLEKDQKPYWNTLGRWFVERKLPIAATGKCVYLPSSTGMTAYPVNNISGNATRNREQVRYTLLTLPGGR